MSDIGDLVSTWQAIDAFFSATTGRDTKLRRKSERYARIAHQRYPLSASELQALKQAAEALGQKKGRRNMAQAAQRKQAWCTGILLRYLTIVLTEPEQLSVILSKHEADAKQFTAWWPAVLAQLPQRLQERVTALLGSPAKLESLAQQAGINRQALLWHDYQSWYVHWEKSYRARKAALKKPTVLQRAYARTPAALQDAVLPVFNFFGYTRAQKARQKELKVLRETHAVFKRLAREPDLTLLKGYSILMPNREQEQTLPQQMFKQIESLAQLVISALQPSPLFITQDIWVEFDEKVAQADRRFAAMLQEFQTASPDSGPVVLDLDRYLQEGRKIERQLVTMIKGIYGQCVKVGQGDAVIGRAKQEIAQIRNYHQHWRVRMIEAGELLKVTREDYLGREMAQLCESSIAGARQFFLDLPEISADDDAILTKDLLCEKANQVIDMRASAVQRGYDERLSLLRTTWVADEKRQVAETALESIFNETARRLQSWRSLADVLSAAQSAMKVSIEAYKAGLNDKGLSQEDIIARCFSDLLGGFKAYMALVKGEPEFKDYQKELEQWGLAWQKEQSVYLVNALPRSSDYRHIKLDLTRLSVDKDLPESVQVSLYDDMAQELELEIDSFLGQVFEIRLDIYACIESNRQSDLCNWQHAVIQAMNRKHDFAALRRQYLGLLRKYASDKLAYYGIDKILMLAPGQGGENPLASKFKAMLPLLENSSKVEEVEYFWGKQVVRVPEAMDAKVFAENQGNVAEWPWLYTQVYASWHCPEDDADEYLTGSVVSHQRLFKEVRLNRQRDIEERLKFASGEDRLNGVKHTTLGELTGIIEANNQEIERALNQVEEARVYAEEADARAQEEHARAQEAQTRAQEAQTRAQEAQTRAQEARARAEEARARAEEERRKKLAIKADQRADYSYYFKEKTKQSELGKILATADVPLVHYGIFSSKRGDRLVKAVAYSLNLKTQVLCHRLADYIEAHLGELTSDQAWLDLPPGVTVANYLEGLRAGIAGENRQGLNLLMRMLSRPIVIFNKHGQIINQAQFSPYLQATQADKPIFLYQRIGVQQQVFYDALVKADKHFYTDDEMNCPNVALDEQAVLTALLEAQARQSGQQAESSQRNQR